MELKFIIVYKKVHSCKDTKAKYRPYGTWGSRSITLLFLDHGTRMG